MTYESLESVVLRILFSGSLLLVAIACLERVANFFGYTVLAEIRYPAGRMLEFAAAFLIVVIALLLRQIRNELKTSAK